MAVNDVTLASIKGKRQGEECIITVQYRTTVSIGDKQLELQALGQGIEEDWFTDAFFPPVSDYMHESNVFDQIKLRDAQQDTVGLDYVMAVPRAGGMTGDELTNDNCFLVLKKTATIGRFATGKNYLPLGTEQSKTNGLWNAGFHADVLASMENVRIIESQAPNFVFVMTVWSAKFQIHNDVTAFRAITEPRRQKRRQLVRG